MTIFDMIYQLQPSYDPRTTLFDMDGVLTSEWYTPEPEPGALEGSARWWSHLADGAALYLPDDAMLGIVTNRLEHYRERTTLWLHSHGLRWGGLTMAKFESPCDRDRCRNPGLYKGCCYLAIDRADLFIESKEQHAITIAVVSQKPVFCTETFTLIEARPMTEQDHETGRMGQVTARFVRSKTARNYRLPKSTVLCHTQGPGPRSDDACNDTHEEEECTAQVS